MRDEQHIVTPMALERERENKNSETNGNALISFGSENERKEEEMLKLVPSKPSSSNTTWLWMTILNWPFGATGEWWKVIWNSRATFKQLKTEIVQLMKNHWNLRLRIRWKSNKTLTLHHLHAMVHHWMSKRKWNQRIFHCANLLFYLDCCVVLKTLIINLNL